MRGNLHQNLNDITLRLFCKKLNSYLPNSLNFLAPSFVCEQSKIPIDLFSRNLNNLGHLDKFFHWLLAALGVIRSNIYKQLPVIYVIYL